MPDINPAALSRPDPLPTANPASLSLSKAHAHGVAALPLQKVVKTVNTAQRIDLEPLYTALKNAIGDNWVGYKESISLFILGGLNQSELSFRIDHYVCVDANTEHLHNSLVAGIYGNCFRDLPEPGVAPWVSANDKPTAVSKPMSGDAAEQRLKTEVMQLPAKDRRRLKEIPEGDSSDFTIGGINDYRIARGIKLPDAVPPSAGGLNKTNWDLEIRKRYHQPLANETGEFPDTESIHNRMLPICYEEGLPNGCAPACADIMALATEEFIKEFVGSVIRKTRSNITSGAIGGTTIMTRKFRQRHIREQAALDKGQLIRNPTNNLLPVEAKEAASRPPVNMGDLRLALTLGDRSLGQFPHVRLKIMGGYPEGVLEDYHDMPELNLQIGEDKHRPMEPPKANGVLTNGVHVNETNTNEDNESYGWPGGGAEDRKKLFSIIDECLGISQ